MAIISDPKKVFNFNIFAPGLNPYAAQKVTVGEMELDVVEHGETNHLIHTAGLIKFGKITVEKLMPVNQADNWIWTWIQFIQNVRTGGGQLASQYKRNFDVVHYSYDNATVTDRWEIRGAFPNKVNGLELNRTTSENSMEVIEFTTDEIFKVK